MYFNLKRFYFGIVGRKRLMLLILILPVCYLVSAAVVPDRFLIKQKISIADDAPIASFVSPVGFMTFGELREKPQEFFLNPFNMKAGIRIAEAAFEDQYTLSELKNIVRQCRFNVSGSNSVQIVYEGMHLRPGKIILSYFADRLITKAREGLMRSNSGKGAPDTVLSGDREIQKIKAIWRAERFSSLVVSICISIVLFFVLIGFIEWTDPSFKSDRQIARYTGLPVIGAVPDLKVVSDVLNKNTEEAEDLLHNQLLPTS